MEGGGKSVDGAVWLQDSCQSWRVRKSTSYKALAHLPAWKCGPRPQVERPLFLGQAAAALGERGDGDGRRAAPGGLDLPLRAAHPP